MTPMTLMLRWVGVGFVCGVMLSVGVSCGGQPRCGASNCLGCCDARGLCQAGNLSSACGGRGSQCQTCALGETCGLGGTCSTGMTGTGGNSAGVGGGSSGVGGGSSSVGGGSSSVGGGSSSVGGGSSSVGGGSSSVGGGSAGAGGGTPACNTCLANSLGQLVCVPTGTNQNLTTCGRNGGLCQNCVQLGATACVMGSCVGSSTGGGVPGVGGGFPGVGGGTPGVGGGTAGSGDAGCLQFPAITSQSFVAGQFVPSGDGGIEAFAALGVLNVNQDAGQGVFAYVEQYWVGARPRFPTSFALSSNSGYQSCFDCFTVRFCSLDLQQCQPTGYFAQQGVGQYLSGNFRVADGGFWSGTASLLRFQAWDFQADAPASNVCIDVPQMDWNVSW